MIDLKEKLLSSFIAFENQTNIDSYVHEVRSEAIKQFESIGFPNKKLENWKYTSLKNLLNTDYTVLPEINNVLEFKNIKKYLIDGEGETLDYKQEISSAYKIAKTMVSFANHKGGVLLVGVRDNRTIAGIRSEDEKYMLDLAASFYCKPEIELELIKELGAPKTDPHSSEIPYAD